MNDKETRPRYVSHLSLGSHISLSRAKRGLYILNSVFLIISFISVIFLIVVRLVKDSAIFNLNDSEDPVVKAAPTDHVGLYFNVAYAFFVLSCLSACCGLFSLKSLFSPTRSKYISGTLGLTAHAVLNGCITLFMIVLLILAMMFIRRLNTSKQLEGAFSKIGDATIADEMEYFEASFAFSENDSSRELWKGIQENLKCCGTNAASLFFHLDDIASGRFDFSIGLFNSTPADNFSFRTQTDIIQIRALLLLTGSLCDNMAVKQSLDDLQDFVSLVFFADNDPETLENAIQETYFSADNNQEFKFCQEVVEEKIQNLMPVVIVLFICALLFGIVHLAFSLVVLSYVELDPSELGFNNDDGVVIDENHVINNPSIVTGMDINRGPATWNRNILNPGLKNLNNLKAKPQQQEFGADLGLNADRGKRHLPKVILNDDQLEAEFATGLDDDASNLQKEAESLFGSDPKGTLSTVQRDTEISLLAPEVPNRRAKPNSNRNPNRLDTRNLEHEFELTEAQRERERHRAKLETPEREFTSEVPVHGLQKETFVPGMGFIPSQSKKKRSPLNVNEVLRPTDSSTADSFFNAFENELPRPSHKRLLTLTAPPPFTDSMLRRHNMNRDDLQLAPIVPLPPNGNDEELFDDIHENDAESMSSTRKERNRNNPPNIRRESLDFMEDTYGNPSLPIQPEKIELENRLKLEAADKEKKIKQDLERNKSANMEEHLPPDIKRQEDKKKRLNSLFKRDPKPDDEDESSPPPPAIDQ